MRIFTPRTLVFWTLALLVGSCATEEGSGGGGAPTVTIAPAAQSGNGQTATVATAVTSALQVIVTENGSPVSGRTVSWSASDGGSVSATSATDVAGIAATQWTLGQTAGGQTASATLAGAGGSPVAFSATATAGPAASITKSDGDAQSGRVNTMLADPLQAIASDQFGNPVGGVAVTWAVTNGTASVNPASSSTSASEGEAETQVTLGGTAGAITIQAVSTGLTGSPLSYTATATVPTMVMVQVLNNRFQPVNITIAAGDTVTWNWPATATNTHNVAPDATEPARSGNPVVGPNTYQFIFTTPGTYQYFCEVHGAPGLTGMSGTVIVQ